MSVSSQVASLAGLWMLAVSSPSLAQDTNMTFFVTSVGTGTGANLGGLAGADQHCLKLAEAAGAGSKTWRAYLSTQAADGTTATNARDRIGKGPWRNAKGVVIAKDVDELHGTNNLTKETALNERGEIVKGRGDQPNMHDMLTGTQPDGTASRRATTGPAATGRRQRLKVRPWSGIMTARGLTTPRRPSPGTRHI